MTNPQQGQQPYVLQPGEGVPGFCSDVKASKRATGGVLTLIESRTTGGAPLHVHTHEDECFYVVEGRITGAAVMRLSKPEKAALCFYHAEFHIARM